MAEQMFIVTSRVIVPSLPRTVPLKNSPFRKLTHDFLCKWQGHWYLVRYGFLFNGACVPGVGRKLLGNPFSPEWLCGSVLGDAADQGVVWEVIDEPAVFNWINASIEIPDKARRPAWFPPEKAHEIFRDVTVASTMLLWWKAKLALMVIRIWHQLFEKPGISKEQWNATNHIKVGHHEGCVRFHENKDQSCGELCDRFFSQG